MKYSENEISKSGIGKLKVAQSINELLADVVKKDAVHIALSENLNDFYDNTNFNKNSKINDNFFSLYRLQNDLCNVVNMNSRYHSVYLYLDNSDYVITSEGVILKENFEDTGWVKTYLDNKNFKKPIPWLNPRFPGIKNSNKKTSASDSDNANKSDYVVSYIYPLTSYTTKLSGAIVINMYESALSKLINSNNFDSEGSISIINSRGDSVSDVDKSIISTNISAKSHINSVLSSNLQEGHLITQINNNRYLVTYLKTDFNDWIYVGAFSLDNLTNSITSMRMLIIYISIILLVLGIFLSYFISRKLYNPVKKLVLDIKSRKGIDIIGNENEVTLLSKAFDSLIKQEDQLFNTIEKNKRHLRENHLIGLLKGKSLGSDEDNEILPHQYFICIIISIDRFNEFVSNFSSDHQYYLKTVILSISEEVIGQSFPCSGLVMEKDRIVLIVNSDSSDYSDILSVLKQSLSIVQKEVSKVIDSSITISISNIYDKLSEIKTSYADAQNLLKLRFIIGHESIICDEDNYKGECRYYYPFTLEKQILNNVDAGSKEALLNSLSDFLKEIKENKKLTYDNVMLILNQLLGSTIKYLLDLNISVSEVFGNDFNIYSRLTENETLDDVSLWLGIIYLQIIEFCEKPRIDSKTHIANIMDYIHKNYKRDIDINMLAEHVGLSYSHVRKIFNDETGENILNYINNLRIEEAQRLLRQTSMNINEIALSLGYNNNQSFNRFFKKYVGITPGEYRNIKLA
ncbi:MAG TPA: AraC family transcriptional regulator [Clostridia bacterium]